MTAPLRSRHGHLARLGEDDRFPFASWAREAGYPYDRRFTAIYARCGSAAEVYFLRPFLERDGCVLDSAGRAVAGDTTLTVQHSIGSYRADMLVTAGALALAIEIDGMAFHHRSAAQVANDYRRQRRIVARGYTLIRFTAAEAFHDAAECWRQVDAIIAARLERCREERA